MLSNHPYRYIVILAVALVAGMTSCKKGSYLTDGGLANAKTTLTNYDYLKSHPYHYFDTTILIIDHFNLKDSVNNAKTFFAFTDFSVTSLMATLQVTTLDELYDSLSSKFVTQYLFGQTITLDGVGTSNTAYTNWAGASAPCGVRKIQESEPIYLTSSTLVQNYYVMQYVKVNGVLDGSPGAPSSDPADVYLSCQTTGIETSSGNTTLHVLANNAVLQKL